MAYTLEQLKRVGIPITMTMLLHAAKRHDTLTYGQVARQISAAIGSHVNPRQIGMVAGELMNRIIQLDKKAPPINVLIIDQTTQLPGEGADWYIKRYTPKTAYSKLTDPEKRAFLVPVQEAIFGYDKWEKTAKKIVGSRARLKIETKSETTESDGKARRQGFGGPAESEEHKRLKEYVSKNPKKFGAPRGCALGKTELRLESSDEIDVWFMNPHEQLAVEVKSRRSSDLDLQRGIFQCVKYRVLVEAQLKVASSVANVRSRLVSERKLPPKLLSWARLLDVEIQEIAPL